MVQAAPPVDPSRQAAEVVVGLIGGVGFFLLGIFKTLVLIFVVVYEHLMIAMNNPRVTASANNRPEGKVFIGHVFHHAKLYPVPSAAAGKSQKFFKVLLFAAHSFTLSSVTK